MPPDELTRASRSLSWLLRHGANESGLAMDAAGWSNVGDVLALLRLKRPSLEAVVRENNKSRYELRGSFIRACQGHSLEGTPVTREALEASWEVETREEPIWHGTRIDALPSIAAEGLLPGARTHVHLAEETDSTVGKRANVDVLLAVSPLKLRAAGFVLYRSPNGVLLAREVPPGCVVDLRAETKKARAQEPALRALFALR